MMESVGSFPPRFVVTYQKIKVSAAPLSSKIVVSVGERPIKFKVNDIPDPTQGNC